MAGPENLVDDDADPDLITAVFPTDEQMRSVCEGFASKLRAGQQISIEEVLVDTNHQNRTTLLSRLILVELHHRWTQGETPSLDEYLARFPSETETIQGLVPEIEKLARRFSLALMETVVKPEVLKRVGHFQIKEVLGRGSFGTVWQAWDTKLKRHVAVKTISHYDDPVRDLPMAMHEAQAVSQLHHEHIVRIYDVEEIEGRLCLVSEYIEGVNLGKELSDGLLDFKKSAYICQKIAEALQHAHDHGVIHRDIKPTNILIDAQGKPMLTDFGVAKFSHAEKTLSDDGKVVGSVRYMSPEQSRAGEIDGRSDVYSLGVVLYELITGKPPFTGSIKEVLFSHQYRDPKLPRSVNPKIPRDLETICVKAMSKNPNDRYRTAGELAEDLGAYVKNEPIKARRVSLIIHSLRRIQRHPRLSFATLVGFVSIPISAALALADFRQTDLTTLGVEVKTDPLGAHVHLVPVDADSNLDWTKGIFPSQPTPLNIRLQPGEYHVFAWFGDRWNTARRMVPQRRDIPLVGNRYYFSFLSDDEIRWAPIALPSPKIYDDMLFIPANDGVTSFWISKNVFRVCDLFKVRPDMNEKMLGPYGKSPRESPLITTFLRAEHWAERIGAQLPSIEQYQRLAEWLLQRKPNGQSIDFEIPEQSIFEWTLSPVAANDSGPMSTGSSERCYWKASLRSEASTGVDFAEGRSISQTAGFRYVRLIDLPKTGFSQKKAGNSDN